MWTRFIVLSVLLFFSQSVNAIEPAESEYRGDSLAGEEGKAGIFEMFELESIKNKLGKFEPNQACFCDDDLCFCLCAPEACLNSSVGKLKPNNSSSGGCIGPGDGGGGGHDPDAFE